MTDKIDWNKAPEGAETYEQCGNGLLAYCKDRHYYLDKWYEKTDPENWAVIATRPTEPTERKTVKDAVEYYKEGLPVERNRTADVVTWDYGQERFYFVSRAFADNSKALEIICTREEFEKAREENVMKKWTHKTSSGYECRIIHEHEGYAWIEYKDIDMQLISPVSGLKPIKPTITKAEAWDMFVNDGWATWDIIEKHDITD